MTLSCVAGNLMLLTPLTPSAREWFDDRLPDDCLRWRSGYVVDSRYVMPILEGFRDDGGTLHPSQELLDA